ncbi:MAG: hypothetical protein SGJ10_14885 [Bacteroidota bacterium]|nr:hypothetical protein [Bacteroidota bacterium]
MKKSILMLAIAGTAMFFMPSCKKAETLLTPIESATVAAGTTYTYVLPTNTDDAFEVTTQPLHGTLSALGVDAAGQLIYQYIPDGTYTGTDKVVISTVKGIKGKCKHPKDSLMPPPPPRDSSKMDSTCKGPRPPKHRKCKKNEALENDYIITINFKVVPR